MEKKITARLNMEFPIHEKVYRKINGRDRLAYKTHTDYICAAVLAFEDETPGVRLAEDSQQRIIEGMLAALEEREKRNLTAEKEKALYRGGREPEI